MKFTKNGVTYDVTDQAHIDCFKAKGWTAVQESPEVPESANPEAPEEAKAPETPAKGKK